MDPGSERGTLNRYWGTNSEMDCEISNDNFTGEEEARTDQAARTVNPERHAISNPRLSTGSQNISSTGATNQQPRHSGALTDSVNITVGITLQIPSHLHEMCPNCRDTIHSTNAYTLSGQDNPTRPHSALNHTITHMEIMSEGQLMARTGSGGRSSQNQGEGVDDTNTRTERARIPRLVGPLEFGPTLNTTWTGAASSIINNARTLTLYPPAAHPTPTGDERLVTYSFQRRSSMDSMLAQSGGDTPRSAFSESSPCTCQDFYTSRNTEL